MIELTTLKRWSRNRKGISKSSTCQFQTLSAGDRAHVHSIADANRSHIADMLKANKLISAGLPVIAKKSVIQEINFRDRWKKDFIQRYKLVTDLYTVV